MVWVAEIVITQPTVLPLSELMTCINAIWERKGIKPKQHLSSPRPGAETMMEKRAHADRCYELPKELPHDMDLMIEVRRMPGSIGGSRNQLISSRQRTRNKPCFICIGFISSRK